MAASVLSDRRQVWAFWLGCAVVTLGVLLHLPMFLMARNMGYQLTGMAMDPGMIAGMGLIIVGIAIACYGLLPRAAVAGADHDIAVTPPEDAPLSRAHWTLMLVLVVALVIDIMKPASLGFTVPGMVAEYGLPKKVIAFLPFSALTGTVVGSVVWGWLADIYGRRASILLSSVMFVGTAICGAMPSFTWNVGMCFLMGAAAGGMLPVTYALLAETMPSKHRGWSLVLVGGLGAVGGYVAASGLSALLQPMFGWRIMWFLNLPTGLLLIFLNGFIPESAKFLLHRGRVEEARATLRRFGSVVMTHVAPGADDAPLHPPAAPVSRRYVGATAALTITAIAWGLINFGLLLWLPAELVAKGYSMALSSRLLAESALIALPTVFVAALLYSRWSTKWSLVLMIAVTGLGLIGVLRLETAAGATISPVLPVALLILGSNGILAILLPFTAETYPLRVRGRATGWVAACSKFGGLLAQVLSILALAPALSTAAIGITIPIALALILVAWFGSETRGRDLRRLDATAA
jgi:MFS transporter, putative metabolite:H+ symporter